MEAISTRSRRTAMGAVSPRRTARRRKTDVADVSVSESDADSMTLPETEAPRVVPVTPTQHVLPISTEGRSLSKALLRLDLRLLGKDTVAWRQMFLLGVILLTGIFLWNNRQSAPSIYIPTLPPIPSFSISSPSPSAPTPSGASPSIDPALANDLKRRLDAVEKELRSLSDRSASSTSDSQKGLQKLRDDLSATQKRVDDSAASLKELSAQAGKDGPVARDLASLSKESVTLAAQHKELAAQYGALAKEQATLGAANKDLAAQQRDLAAQQREVAAQQARLREELAGMVKDVSERLKSESAARAELAAELQRYKAAAPAAKEEAEEKLRTRVKALVAELLPAQAPAAPASTHSAPSPAPVVREFKLAEHRAALEALIQEVLKRDSPDFATSLAAQKGNVQMWAQDAVGPDIRRLDARDRELADKLTSTAAAVAAVQASAAAAPTAAPATSASGGASEARVAELIDAALEQYAADRLAVPDYALESAGASIVRWRTSPSYRSGSWLAVPRPLGPSVALQPDVHVGRCFAFAGSQGNITVHLAAAVAPTAVSIEHVSSRIAHDVDSAPRDFAVWGMKHETDEGEQMVKLGQFTYDTKDKHALQTFPIKAATDAPAFPLVMLQVLSNHGHDAFTCIYRFRVHGKEADA